MPRLSPSLLHCAHVRSPLLPLLLRPCRDLQSAKNELRWLKEHAISTAKSQTHQKLQHLGWRYLLVRCCHDRARGIPLQYIIGNQPFGNLKILCRSGVLIPRSETEAWTMSAADLIQKSFARPQAEKNEEPRPLRILDLCTGTGCIALYLHSLLHKSFPDLEVLGLDLSPKALGVAHANLHRNVRGGYLHPSAEYQVRFLNANLLDTSVRLPRFDVVVSNPPYISPTDFSNGETDPSVRRYEPRMALVPTYPGQQPNSKADRRGDLFYPRILELAGNQGASLLVMEVGGLEQAKRVAKLAVEKNVWGCVEIWRDSIEPGNGRVVEDFEVQERKISVRGEGNGRVVACWRERPSYRLKPFV